MKFYNNFNEMFNANVSHKDVSVFNNMETLYGTAHLYHFKVVPTKNAPKTKAFNLMPTNLDEFKKAVDVILETSEQNDGFVYQNSPIEMWGDHNIQLTTTKLWAKDCYNYINRMKENNGYKFCSISSRKEKNSDKPTAKVYFYDTDDNIISVSACPRFYADSAQHIADNLGNIFPGQFHSCLGNLEDTLKTDDEMIRYTISFSKKCEEFNKYNNKQEDTQEENRPNFLPGQQVFPFLNE